MTVEVRSVNHRFADIQPRLPAGYFAIEDRVRRIVGEYVERGRVEIFVSIEEFRGNDRTVRLDRGLLDGYLAALSEARRLAGLDGELGVEALLQLPGLFIVDQPEENIDATWPLIEEALRQALEGLIAMRRTEGTRLYGDIIERLDVVEEIIEAMGARAPEVVEAYRRRLAERMAELLGDLPVDEDRITQEVAIFADKSNIDEELTRARSHITQFRVACRASKSVGRKLDFLLQELNREVNTIASKANDATLADWVVQVKAELEKVREQVQNVE